MSFFKFVFVALFCLSLSKGAIAQSPEAVARCMSVQVPQFRQACFEAIRPKAQQTLTPPAPLERVSKSSPSQAAQSIEGLWAQTKEECLDEDGPNSRTLIDLRNVIRGKLTPIFDQYENHCRIERKSVLSDGTTLAVTCFEFWEEFTKDENGRKASIKLSLGQSGGLRIDGKVYQRCEAKGVTPAAPIASSPAAVSRPFVVTIKTSVSGGTRPIVTGTTNLPDGTHLYMSLNKPFLPNGKERLAAGLAACGDDCAPLTTAPEHPLMDTVVVKNGQFSDGPFTDYGSALRPGTYILDVWPFGSVFGGQPPDVLGIIGQHGENMTGPLIGACCPGTHFGMEVLANFQAEKQRMMDEARRSAPITGATVYYGRSVVIGRN